jgi:cytosine/adenosine deaminase-related metal-dependent hydrolase
MRFRRLIARGVAALPAIAAGLLVLMATGAAAAPCRATAGADGLLIRARLLTDAPGPPRRGEVRLDTAGTIACVGKGCGREHPQAARLDCPDALLSPGFINLHEHLPFAHIAPAPDDGVRYGQRHDWRLGLRGRPKKEGFTASFDPDVLAWGELRHLLSGATAIVGGAMAPGLARNLDIQAGLEGLKAPHVTNAVFPLDDAAGLQREGDCDYGPRAVTEAQVGGLAAYVAHVAEGRDGVARNEFACLSDAGFDTTPAPGGGGISHDILLANLVIVHGVALTRPMLAKAAARGAALVWSPRSNLSLYGQTLDVAAALDLSMTVALGTDWLPSGSISMPREAACALAYSRAHLGGRVTPREVWRMMTLAPAKAVRMDGLIGAIRPGLAGDLILVAGGPGDAYGRVALAAPQDLLLVLRGGRPLAGRAALIATLNPSPDCEAVDLNGAADAVCIAGETGKTYRALAAEMAARGVWPAAFKGPPPIEPTCEARD